MVSSPTEIGNVTSMLGNTTVSSRGTKRNLVMVSETKHLLEVVKYRGPRLSCRAVARAAGSHAAESWRLLFELVLAERRRVPAIAAALALSPAQCHALRILEPGKPMSMRRLADALACDASNVTGIVDRLEARGLVERRNAPHDRRVRVLAVTTRGASVRARMLARLTAVPPPLRRLTRAEQRALCTLLRRALGPRPV